MGLFDSLTSDPDQQRALMQGLLSGAFGAMAGRGSRLQAWGQGGLAGLMGYQGSLDKTAQAKQQALQNERQALQDQLLRGQIGQQQRQAQIQALPGQFYRAPSMPGVDATGGMDTAMENPANQASPEGRFDMGGYQNALMGLDPVQALQLKAMTAKQEPALREIDPTKNYGTFENGQFKPLISGQPKPDKGTTDWENYSKAVEQGYKGDFIGYQREMANLKAPRSDIRINTPDKVWERENALRKEFNSLPEVIRYKSALPAFKAVESAANRMGAQSDINLIYGIAKLYDPESVVREGEYATIANSQAIPERIKGFAQRLTGGGSLTAQTKQELLAEARQRIGALESEYNGARGTYEGIVDTQGGNRASVFTPVGVNGSKSKSGKQGGGLPSMSDIDAELAKRRGGR